MFNRYIELDGEELEFVFGNSVMQNINYALISLEYILNVNNYDEGLYINRHTYYFFHIQSLLTACGCISNVFYTYVGFDKKATQRCANLRETFNINRREFPLIFQKEARNTNEHFDERYDEFGYNIGDYNILNGSIDEKVRKTIEKSPHLRTYDEETKIYYTYNRRAKKIEYNFNNLREELMRMKDRILNNPYYISAWDKK